MSISDGISAAALAVSIIVGFYTWRANPRPSLEVDKREPLEAVVGKAWDSEWNFRLTNRGRGDATYIRVFHEVNGVKTLLRDDLLLRQGQSWNHTIGFSRAQVLAMINPIRPRRANQVLVVYRGNTDGKDRTKIFDPPMPI